VTSENEGNTEWQFDYGIGKTDYFYLVATYFDDTDQFFLIGNFERTNLYVLSREREPNATKVEKELYVALQSGYNIYDIVTPYQGVDCTYDKNQKK
jgi:lipocalin